MNPLPGVEQLLAELIRIPSVNPAGNPGVDDPGEAGCANYLAGLLKQLGANVELWDVMPGRPNVLGKFPASTGEKPVLLLAPHTDTVSVQGMTIEPFAAEMRDGRIFGRGATDTKGSMASMLAALGHYREQIAELPVEIWFAGLMGEEAGQLGARDFCRKYRPDFVVVGEPTGLDMVYAHKGCVWIDIKTHGHAVHASVPEDGESAILKMLDLLDYFRNTLAPQMAESSDPLLGVPTMNIGTIDGGSKINIVPDSCSCGVDIRTVPALDCKALISDTINALQEIVPDAEVSYTLADALDTDPSHPLAAKLLECGAKLTTAPWFCDAAVFAASGIPAVAVGPGTIAQAHTRDEFIAIDDLIAGEQFFMKFIDHLAASDPTSLKNSRT